MHLEREIIELHNFHGYYEQRWNVEHVWNGYYKIISTYSDKALTAPTGANNDVVTQTTYTENVTQRWRFIEQSDGTYKISPESNSNYFMAAGDISSTADQDLEIRTAQSDGGDRWEVKQTYVSVEFYYDNGFVIKRKMRHGDDYVTAASIERDVATTYFSQVEYAFALQFGINLEFKSIESYVSDGDNCPDLEGLKCTCIGDAQCVIESGDDPHQNNNVVGFIKAAHCTNYARLRNNMIVGIPDNTMRIALTGYYACIINDKGEHDIEIEGLSNYDYPIIAIRQPAAISNSRFIELIAHEISHSYGTQHHDDGRRCIMDEGGAKDIDYQSDTNYWCDECRTTIQSNIGKYLG